MAEKSGERRMLFDTRGRRRNVIRVVYATLALLMGASLFVAVGPFNIAEILGTNSGNGDAAEVFEEEAERIEQRLAKDPTDEALLLRLTRARISAGNALTEVSAGGAIEEVPLEAKQEFGQALETWNSYLKQADEPSVAGAQLVAFTFFRLAESETGVRGAEENVAKATQAQRVAAEQRPSVNSLTTLAIYEYFNGDFKAGEEAKAKAIARASSKAEVKAIESQLVEYRKNGKQFEKQKQELAKFEKEAGGQAGQSPNPFALPGTGTPAPGE
jgi:hypothetical protein